MERDEGTVVVKLPRWILGSIAAVVIACAGVILRAGMLIADVKTLGTKLGALEGRAEEQAKAQGGVIRDLATQNERVISIYDQSKVIRDEIKILRTDVEVLRNAVNQNTIQGDRTANALDDLRVFIEASVQMVRKGHKKTIEPGDGIGPVGPGDRRKGKEE